MKLLIDFSKMEYREPKGNLDYFFRSFRLLLRDWIQATPVNPPLRYRGSLGIFRRISYQFFGKEIRFDDDTLNTILVSHARRLILYDFLSGGIYSLLILLSAVGGIISWLSVRNSVWWGGILVMILLIGIVILSARIAEVLVARHFADSLAAISGVYLYMELEKDVSLNNPYQRRNLLERCHYLERNLILLVTTFGGRGAENDRRFYQRFEAMRAFVQKLEYEIVASGEDTLAKLRQDFPAFLEILITGQYGKFAVEPDPDALQNAASEQPQSALDNFLRLLVTTFPFVLLAVLFFLPEKIIALGIDSTIVLLASLAWILLVIDANLKLGIVERATTLMKTMKELR
jgi:hypothetical protein